MIKNLNLEFPDGKFVYPERKAQQFDYRNEYRACTMMDIDFCFNKDDKIVFVESKASAGYASDAQRRLYALLCQNDNCITVIARHDEKVNSDYVPMVDGWSQKVDEVCIRGDWYAVAGIPLKEYINEYFKKQWGYSEDVVR